jgi:hypothetical protein
LVTNVGDIQNCGLNEDSAWSESDYKLFNENIDKIGARIEETKFDMKLYARFYCEQDVRILRKAFNAFRDGFLEDFELDVFDYVSISALANEVFNQRVYNPNGNLFKVSGIIRAFLAQAIHGGRCMCAFNKKWDIKEALTDFDAVSLYPSAMTRLYTVSGKPKVLDEPKKLTYEWLKNQSAYVVEIEITKIGKRYPFPLITQKVNGLNLNNDELTPGSQIKMFVDNIYLEDLIEFQKIEFKIIRGYYWSGDRDYRIQDEIRKIFAKRVEYKKEKKSLEALYKLIMNSCYGKTIERAVEKDYVFKHEGDEFNKFMLKNYNTVVEDVQLRDSNIHMIKRIKPIDKHFNFSLLGIHE